MVDIPDEAFVEANKILEFSIISREDISDGSRSLSDVAPNTHVFKSTNFSLDSARELALNYFFPRIEFVRHDINDFDLSNIPCDKVGYPWLPMFIMELYTESPEKRKPFKKCVAKHDTFTREDLDQCPGQLHCISVDLRKHRYSILDDIQKSAIPFTVEAYRSIINSSVVGKCMYGVHSLYQVRLVSTKGIEAPLSLVDRNSKYFLKLEALVRRHLKEEKIYFYWNSNVIESDWKNVFYKGSKTSLTCSLNALQNLFGVKIPKYVMYIASRIVELQILRTNVSAKKRDAADAYCFATWCNNLWIKNSWSIETSMEVARHFFIPKLLFVRLGKKNGHGEVIKITDPIDESSSSTKSLPMYLVECYATKRAVEDITGIEHRRGPTHCIAVDLRYGRNVILDDKCQRPIPFTESTFYNHVNNDKSLFGVCRIFKVISN